MGRCGHRSGAAVGIQHRSNARMLLYTSPADNADGAREVSGSEQQARAETPRRREGQEAHTRGAGKGIEQATAVARRHPRPPARITSARNVARASRAQCSCYQGPGVARCATYGVLRTARRLVVARASRRRPARAGQLPARGRRHEQDAQDARPARAQRAGFCVGWCWDGWRCVVRHGRGRPCYIGCGHHPRRRPRQLSGASR
jgi:hypothetical protein